MTGGLGAGRILALTLVAWLGTSLAASVQAVVPLPRLPGIKPAPDVVLLVVLFAGLSGRGTVPALALLAVGLGYLADLAGGAPRGLHMIACLLLALLSRVASSRLMVRGVVFTGLVAASFAALYHGGLAALRVALDPSLLAAGWPGLLGSLPLSVLSATLFGPPLFALLSRFDRALGRDPRALPLGRA
jgi:rod shape-determining protein MreD